MLYHPAKMWNPAIWLHANPDLILKLIFDNCSFKFTILPKNVKLRNNKLLIIRWINDLNTKITMQKKRFLILVSIVIAILLIPFVAMQFSNEVKWGLLDFVVAGILLFSTAFMIDFIIRKFHSTLLRILFCGLIFFVVFLIWAELAVGIFGTPFAGS